MFPVLMSALSSDNGERVPATAKSASIQAITLAVGQVFVTIAFVVVTVDLLWQGRPVDEQLWTLVVAIVSFYLGQRVNLVQR